MADERTPVTPDDLKEVLDRLNEVLEEAARLRKDVIRQLSDARASGRQQLAPERKRKASKKR